jgi:hypothetical protein
MIATVEDRARWKYLLDLLTKQLRQFETGAMKMSADGVDISGRAIGRLKRNIKDVEHRIARDRDS